MNVGTRKTLGAAAVCTATFALVFGCVEPVRDVGSEYAPDAGSGPVGFVAPPDGSTADATSTPSTPLAEMCVGTQCPYPYGTCARPDGTIPYKCEVNFLADDNHCGECGHACPGLGSLPEMNITGHCVDGKCQALCNIGTFDCNGLIDDGCEVRPDSDPDNCGACGNVCPELVNGKRGCTQGKCNQECLPPKTWCDPTCSDLNSDLANCGGCGDQCPYLDPPWGMVNACIGGECGHFRCGFTTADCNDDLEDGCETDIFNDLANCGACGNACAPGQICIVRPDRGPNPVCACDPSETLCGFSCTDLLSDVDNCGACGNRCLNAAAHGLTTCTNGYCQSECAEGWGDCDGDIGNGCETELSRNARHCGTCGNQCDVSAGQPCIDGKCLLVECDAGVETK